MRLSIIVPVYNESQTIGAIIRKIRAVILPGNITKEIIAVNDGSTDDSAEILKKYAADSQIKIFCHDKSMGKSQAVKLGIEKSTGDVILIQDADLEYNPESYPGLIKPIIEHKSSVVYGSRFKGAIKGMGLINRIANILSNATLNLLFRAKITDVNTCYKVFKKEVLKDIELTSKGFTFETELTAKLLKKGYDIYEVPISYNARSKKEGKKINWPNALQMYWGIIKYKWITL